jgi:hypothetical protein
VLRPPMPAPDDAHLSDQLDRLLAAMEPPGNH